MSSSDKPSSDRILEGDIPLPENGYCPFPKDVCSHFDCGNYYRAMNNITCGILNDSPAIHLSGLRILFEIGEEYCTFVKYNLKPYTPKNFYYPARSGTGIFQHAVLWVHRDLIKHKADSAYYDSTAMLSIIAAEEILPDAMVEANGGNWVRLQDHVKIFRNIKEVVTLGDFSRNSFDDTLSDQNMDTSYYASLKEIVSGYTVSMADFWKLDEYLVSYQKGLIDSLVARGDQKFAFWIGSDEDLKKLYGLWTNPIDPLILCRVEDFISRMRGNPDSDHLIVWLKKKQDLAWWIGSLSDQKRIIGQAWKHVPSAFRTNDDKHISPDSLRAMIANRDKADDRIAIFNICKQDFPLPSSPKR